MKTHRGRRPFLSSTHPLADVARRRCYDVHGWAGQALIGAVACGECWEYAIRADERVVVEHDLPPVPVRDPELIDEVAVARACRGEKVKLTRAERAVVANHRARRSLAARCRRPSALAKTACDEDTDARLKTVAEVA